jgi:hypothetical protein
MWEKCGHGVDLPKSGSAVGVWQGIGGGGPRARGGRGGDVADVNCRGVDLRDFPFTSVGDSGW